MDDACRLVKFVMRVPISGSGHAQSTEAQNSVEEWGLQVPGIYRLTKSGKIRVTRQLPQNDSRRTGRN
jgi:hypothetical protein